MKAFFQLAPVLACVFSLHAQVTAVLNRFPARSPEIVVRNNSAVNLTALAVSMAPAQSSAFSAPFLFLSTLLLIRTGLEYRMTSRCRQTRDTQCR